MKKEYFINHEDPVESIVKIWEDIEAESGKDVEYIKLQPSEISGPPSYIEIKISIIPKIKVVYEIEDTEEDLKKVYKKYGMDQKAYYIMDRICVWEAGEKGEGKQIYAIGRSLYLEPSPLEGSPSKEYVMAIQVKPEDLEKYRKERKILQLTQKDPALARTIGEIIRENLKEDISWKEILDTWKEKYGKLEDFLKYSFYNITGENLEEILELIERKGRPINREVYKSNIVEEYREWKEISLDRLDWNILGIRLISKQTDIEKIKSEQYDVDKFIDLFKNFRSNEFEISLGRKLETNIKTSIDFYPSQEHISVEIEFPASKKGSKILKQLFRDLNIERVQIVETEYFEEDFEE